MSKVQTDYLVDGSGDPWVSLRQHNDLLSQARADAWDEGFAKGYKDGAHADDFSREFARNPYLESPS